MIEYDNEDNPGFDFSPFDRAKIEDLETGESMESESGTFGVYPLGKGYHVWCLSGKQTGVFVLSSLEEVFEFLENN